MLPLSKLVWFLVLNIGCMLLVCLWVCGCVGVGVGVFLCVFLSVYRFSHSFGMEDKSITVIASLFFFPPLFVEDNSSRAICY